MSVLKEKIKAMDPTHVKFHLNFEMLKAMVEEHVLVTTSQKVSVDFRAVEDTGRVLVDFDLISVNDEKAVSKACLYRGVDDDCADALDEVLEGYYGVPVCIYANCTRDGHRILEDFDVMVDFESYVDTLEHFSV